MYIKNTIVDVAPSLPDNAVIDDMRYRLMVIETVNKGLQEIRDGKGIPHHTACELLGRKWNMK
jgi:hypothetical protein